MRVQVYVPRNFNDGTPVPASYFDFTRAWLQGAYRVDGLSIDDGKEGVWGLDGPPEPMRIYDIHLRAQQVTPTLAYRIANWLARDICCRLAQAAVHIVINDEPYDVLRPQTANQSGLEILGASSHVRAVLKELGVQRPAIDDAVVITDVASFDRHGQLTDIDVRQVSRLPAQGNAASKTDKRGPLEERLENRRILHVRSVSTLQGDVPRVSLDLGVTRYFDYYRLRCATLENPLSLDALETSRRVLGRQPGELPIAAAVAPIVLTSDGFLLVARRSAGMAFAPGAWAVTMEEVMLPSDRDLKAAAQRGVQEELRLSSSATRPLAVLYNLAANSIDIPIIVSVPVDRQAVSVAFSGRGGDQELSRLDFVDTRDDGARSHLIGQLCTARSYQPSTAAINLEPASLEPEAWHPDARLRLYLFLAYKYGYGFVDGAIIRKYLEDEGRAEPH
jgi:hypothetical protein